MSVSADETTIPRNATATSARALQVSSPPWRTTVAVILVIGSSIATLIVVSQIDLDKELKTALYAGAATLLFGGLLGGLLRILLEDVATARARRADAATFISNVLTDLKAVYDRVGRAKIVIPAHQSVKTYGDEMRDLIESQVQLRNVVRALEGRSAGVSPAASADVISDTQRMEAYLGSLTTEFKKHYHELSYLQRAYEGKVTAMVQKFAASNDTDPPAIPGPPWDKLKTLPVLNDFVSHGPDYLNSFYKPLDHATMVLRGEVARILGYR